MAGKRNVSGKCEISGVIPMQSSLNVGESADLPHDLAASIEDVNGTIRVDQRERRDT